MSVDAVGTDCDTVNVTVGDVAEGVTTVTLNRPAARNALNEQLRTELAAVLDAIAKSDTRVVVLTGETEAGAFAAGGDVREMQSRSPLEQRSFMEAHRIYQDVSALPQPVIARVNGLALGGGCELALACDVRIAHSDAMLGQPECRLGLIPGGGATQRLPRLIGEGQAMRLMLSGELVDATEAEEIGLVDEVYDEDKFDDRVYELAERMASKSPVALKLCKQAVQAAATMDLDTGIQYETELFTSVFASEDAAEGIAAFLEDREPKWVGR